MAFKILDISRYQPNVDYAKTSEAVDGVIIRCGLTYWGAQNMGKDPCFDRHYAGFKAQGLPMGAYYYSCADSVEKAKKEAEFCLGLLKGKQFELPIFFDVENNERQGNLSKALLTEIADTFCGIVEKAGYFVGVYASTSWLTGKLDHKALGAKYTLWKADYRAACDKTIPCGMHQYTSTAKVDGISGHVDMSNCFVDYKLIIKECGLNGFERPEGNKPGETPCQPIRLIIGPMSKGDVMTFAELLDNLKIEYEVTNGGFIITKHTVSYGDIVTIEGKADDIGNIDIQEYEADITKPEQCAECDLLTAEVEKLKKENEQINKLLAAEREANAENSKALAQYKDKLKEIIKIAEV